MLEIVIAVCAIVIIMIALMSLLLKRFVKTISEQSKVNFVEKLQNYDELVDAKEAELSNLSKNIEELNSNTNNNQIGQGKNNDIPFFYNIDIPSYVDDDFFENYKKINEQFDFNNQKIILDFIENKVSNDNTKYYEVLLNLKNKFNYDLVYDLLTLPSCEQLIVIEDDFNLEEQKILNDYLEDSMEFNSLEFADYLDELIRQNDPTIYIRVSDKKENYNDLNKYIKTEYIDNIYVGMSIIYKNKIYDYSLN